MDFLKQQLAPMTEEAWQHVEAEARGVLSTRLAARKVVTVSEPRGFDFSAVNLGTMSASEKAPRSEGVRVGVRRVLPLVEARVPFKLDLETLDDLSRGAPDADLEPLIKACIELASFEDRLVFNGFPEAGVNGMSNSTAYEPVPLPSNPAEVPAAVSRAVVQLEKRGVPGPYALVLSETDYERLQAQLEPVPPRDRVEKILGGPIAYSSVIDQGLLVSLGGGAFELALGQDASIGYASHDARSVDLYLIETLTFRMIKPDAVVRMPSAA